MPKQSSVSEISVVMAVCSFYTVTALILFLFYLSGLHNFFKPFKYNGCEMTYMYEYPQYVRVSLPSNVSELYKRYGLYAYAEGHLIKKARQMRFSGIPVLFIPGNSGSPKQGFGHAQLESDHVWSHQQVRSLASVSLRKALGSRMPFHFDYFTLDLNDELSGLYGGVLLEQTAFAVHCVRRILELYTHTAGPAPTSVVLIGHSMGGMIAKGMFLEAGFDASRLVVTLATPHSPALLLDPDLASYYRTVDDLWGSDANWTGRPTLVSVGGGDRDRLVNSPGLTHTVHADISVTSSTVPGVWLPTDHLCILWCRQLVLVLVRALFDCVDVPLKKISRNATFRRDVFAYHLVHRSGGKRYATSQHEQVVVFGAGNNRSGPGRWEEGLQRQWSTVDPTGTSEPWHVMTRLRDHREHEMLAIVSGFHRTRDWLFACKADAVHGNLRFCETGENLSSKGRIAPTRTYKRMFALLNMTLLHRRGFSHVVARILPTREPVALHMDVHDSAARTLTPVLPNMLSPLTAIVVERTAERALYYRLELPSLRAVYHAYLLRLTTVGHCLGGHQATASFYVPWSSQGATLILSNYTSGILLIHLSTSKPPTANGTAVVHITLDPACIYTISMESSLANGLGGMSRAYTARLPGYVAACLLLALSHQLLEVAGGQDGSHCGGHCPLFHTALVGAARPFVALPITNIVGMLLGRLAEWSLLSAWLPPPDRLDSVWLSVVLFTVAFAICYILGALLLAAVLFYAQAYYRIVLSIMTRMFGSWGDWVLTGLGKVSPAVVAILVSLVYGACGGLALAVGTAYYFMQLCGMYEDCLQSVVLYPLHVLKRWLQKIRHKQTILPPASSSYPPPATTSSPLQESPPQPGPPCEAEKSLFYDFGDVLSLSDINFHQTVFMLWCLVSMMHIPALLEWARNYRYNQQLVPDSSFYYTTILCISAGALWHGNYPKQPRLVVRGLSGLLIGLAGLCLTHATISVYRLSYIVTVALAALSAVQAICPWLSADMSNMDGGCSGDNGSDGVDTIGEAKKSKEETSKLSSPDESESEEDKEEGEEKEDEEQEESLKLLSAGQITSFETISLPHQ